MDGRILQKTTSQGSSGQAAAQMGGELEASDVAAHKQARQVVGPLVWYCPSRWLLAHHDPQANIQTLSSHMCLADLNNDGESLLALIDFKKQQQQPARRVGESAPPPSRKTPRPPYECRMRVYRGQQLIYNHFLDDMPSSLIAVNIGGGGGNSTLGDNQKSARNRSSSSRSSQAGQQQQQQQPILTLSINDDVYFYDKLRPSFRLSLEDEDCVLDSLSKSEVDAWQMVKQNQVDTETMRELLQGLASELGNQELTSHSLNFLALESSDSRARYLTAWKMKKLGQNNLGEHLESMDTICCSAARLKYTSNVTQSGDFGQTHAPAGMLYVENARWLRLLDIQRDGLVLGTEDRHLLVYELRGFLGARSQLECHYRLPSTPDQLLIERCSPASFDVRANLRELTYQILISCRNCRIYTIDQLYLVDQDQRSSPCAVRELVALKCNVVAMSWTGLDDSDQETSSSSVLNCARPGGTFVVACLDRRVYCFGSRTGACKWLVELELPITCLVCLPRLKSIVSPPEESSLVGVASQANRMDFYVGSSGRIVDSIYFSRADFPVAATFGRFGREDNCLCLVTRLGLLSIFILKRTAKFAHGQCLSSAASYASDTLATCSQLLQQSVLQLGGGSGSGAGQDSTETAQQLKPLGPAQLPSGFALSKSSATTATDQMINSMLQQELHQCDQVTTAKSALDAYTTKALLPIPAKSRQFVGQILDQARQSRSNSRVFANQMVKLRNKLNTMQAADSLQLVGGSKVEDMSANHRLLMSQVLGLGNTYRVQLSLRLNLERFIEHHSRLFSHCGHWRVTLLFIPTQQSQSSKCSIKPHKRILDLQKEGNRSDDSDNKSTILEATVEFKLQLLVASKVLGVAQESAQGETKEIQIQALASHCSPLTGETLIRRPLLVSSINVPIGSQ